MSNKNHLSIPLERERLEHMLNMTEKIGRFIIKTSPNAYQKYYDIVPQYNPSKNEEMREYGVELGSRIVPIIPSYPSISPNVIFTWNSFGETNVTLYKGLNPCAKEVLSYVEREIDKIDEKLFPKVDVTYKYKLFPFF